MGTRGTGKIIDIDRGMRELKKTLATLKNQGSYVKVGVFGAEAAESRDGVTNADLAIIQELGAPSVGIPARPWIGGTFDKNRAKYTDMLARGLARLYENKLTVKQLLGLLGVAISSDIKQAVMQGSNFAPNAPSTVERKKSARPLLDTARMVGSVSHEVVLSGEGE